MKIRKLSCVVALSALLGISLAANAEPWTKTFAPGRSAKGKDVLLLADGGILVLGDVETQTYPVRVSCIALIKLNADGDMVWERLYEGIPSSSAQSLIAQGNGYAIAGTVQSETGGDADSLLLIVDSEGNDIWSRTFGTAFDEYASTILPMDDGGYVLIGDSVDPNDQVIDNPGTSGYSGYAGRSNSFVVRTDAEGREIWSHRITTQDNTITTGGAVTSDGRIVVLSYILRFPILDEDIRLFCVDADGNTNWTREWTEGRASGYDLAATSDGDVVISGWISGHGDPQRTAADALLIRVNQEGDEVWLTTYGEPYSVESAHVVTETADGRIIGAGWQMGNLNTSTDNILFVTFDRNGSLLGQEVKATSSHNIFGGLIEHADGSVVLASTTGTWTTRYRMQVMKTELIERSDD